MDIIDTIKEQIASHDILLYMKGSPKLPQCGFSSHAVQILMDCGAKFAYVDILANPEVRASLPKHANWPTFPQLWIKSELIGGSDIMLDMYNSGDLQKIISDAASKPEDDDGK
ncbi:MAG: Grx4 family monothiol glutaredoxin [Candidatus Endonucleobacter bathymodioli]|uniref:Glutaredoxin n=1 Tax=Candidatus Endonucleibacter bathymodioli TaxID=539814 RepID=A0AA90SSR0_9GAMM|nr:Grx4 family monothiol glutaredoxin [Candidatus Endonucleobacter bathymodioli]